MKKTGLLAMVLAMVLVFGFAAGVMAADINFAASATDQGLKSFYLALGDYNKVQEQDIMTIKQRGIPDEELPVVFYIAAKTGAPPQEIVRLRLKKYSWMSIISKYRLHPSVFYVPVKTQVFGTIYKKPYSYYTTRPEAKWSGIRLSDSDVVNFVNLRFVSEHYGYEPDEVIKMREGGRNFIVINSEVNAWKAKKKFIKVKKEERAMNRFYRSIAEYYGLDEAAVMVVKERGLSDNDIAVVFFLASEAGVHENDIVKLRLNGWNWMRIVKKYKLDPGIFYVPVKGQVTGNIYGRPYGYYSRPQDKWKSINLADDDVTNCVNLKFVSEYHGYDPVKVIKMREDGRNFTDIDNDIRVINVKNKKVYKFNRNDDDHNSWKDGHDGDQGNQGNNGQGNGSQGNDNQGNNNQDNDGQDDKGNHKGWDKDQGDNGKHKGWDKEKDDKGNKKYKYYDE